MENDPKYTEAIQKETKDTTQKLYGEMTRQKEKVKGLTLEDTNPEEIETNPRDNTKRQEEKAEDYGGEGEKNKEYSREVSTSFDTIFVIKKFLAQ